MRTDLYVISKVTGDSITPGKRIPGNKRNNKSPAMSPQRKDPIPNQDKNTLGIEKDQSLPPHVPKFSPGFKSLINEAYDDNHESTNTSRPDKNDTSRTDKYDYIENLKAMRNKNDDDK